MILTRRYVVVAAALATAVLAVLVPAAGTATPEPSLGVLRAKLRDAIADEERALTLLAKSPPRYETAALMLDRSLMQLLEIRDAVPAVALPLHRASNLDASASQNLRLGREDFVLPRARRFIEDALSSKAEADGGLRPPPSSGVSQCADGRDNDGDRLWDARYDSGCTNATDGSEGSPLTCSLGYVMRGSLYVIEGTCSGPFGKIEINAPPDAAFNTKLTPTVGHARVCYFSSERRLDCVMSDGAANPRHVVKAGLKYKNVPASGRPKVTIRDFSRRGRTWTPSQQPVSPPAEPPFSLGSSPVSAVGTFTNGRGGCPVLTSFTDGFQFLAPGDGTLTITQPKTGDRVSGPIKPDGSFQLRSAGESYDGRITGTTATATYSYTTAQGCTETYDASFVLQR